MVIERRHTRKYKLIVTESVFRQKLDELILRWLCACVRVCVRVDVIRERTIRIFRAVLWREISN